MKRILVGLTIAVLLIAAGCGNKPAATVTSYFPESNEVSGWTKGVETRTFTAENLWQYIDGDADRYVQAGAVRTLTNDYRYLNSTDAVADVYVMKDAAGATKIFDGEPAKDSEQVSVGDSARLYGGSLTFRKGPYFVRLVAYKSSPEVAAALSELARGIAKKLP